ncbi:hypothetical protein [Pararhizobium sp. O133]
MREDDLWNILHVHLPQLRPVVLNLLAHLEDPR